MRVDETRLGQVLVHLLVNAAHAIAPGDPDANSVAVSTRLDDDGSVLMAVSDTGCGIAPEAMSRIFEPFFTMKVIGTGAGLGLSICHSIVTSMGGELAVESRVGEGTTFQLKLPVSTGEPSLPSAPAEPVHLQALRRPRLARHRTAASRGTTLQVGEHGAGSIGLAFRCSQRPQSLEQH